MFVVTWEEASSPEQHGLISREFSYQMYLGDPWAYFWDEHKVNQGFSGLSIPPKLLQEFIARIGRCETTKNKVSLGLAALMLQEKALETRTSPEIPRRCPT